MNIFYLDSDPRQCAQWMVDKHVVKMILESAQLLSTAHRFMDGVMRIDKVEKNGKIRNKKRWIIHDARDTILYHATHINHPSAIWARTSVENYNWLADHLFALGDEYRYRYNKTHLTIAKLGLTLNSPPFNLREWDMTRMPSCMDEQYKISDDPIFNYRTYYIKGKAHLKKYTKRNPPVWWLDE